MRIEFGLVLTIVALIRVMAVNAATPAMDCNQLASMPGAPMTVEQCKSLMKSAKSGEAAMADKSAALPGDDAMSCAQIGAEMATFQNVSVSKQSIVAGSKASAEYQEEYAKQMAAGKAVGTRQQAEKTTAFAADRTTEIVSGGVIPGQALNVVNQAHAAETAALGERQSAALQPKQQAVMGATQTSIGEVVGQLQQNPRLARLGSLAMAKKCKFQGNM
jgi:hypothetical protein